MQAPTDLKLSVEPRENDKESGHWNYSRSLSGNGTGRCASDKVHRCSRAQNGRELEQDNMVRRSEWGLQQKRSDVTKSIRDDLNEAPIDEPDQARVRIPEALNTE